MSRHEAAVRSGCGGFNERAQPVNSRLSLRAHAARKILHVLSCYAALWQEDRPFVRGAATNLQAKILTRDGADNLEGQPDWRSPGENGRLPAAPHDASGHTWHHDGDTLFRLTKFGTGALIGDSDYESNMPIYDEVLSDEEIIAVFSYIKSTWPDEIRERHDEMEKRK